MTATTGVKRTAPKLAAEIVRVIRTIERPANQALWPITTEIHRVGGAYTHLAFLVADGFVNSVSGEGKVALETVWWELLRVLPARALNDLDVDYSEWRIVRDGVADNELWWKVYRETLAALRAPNAEQVAGRASTPRLEGEANDAANEAVQKLRAERAAKREAVSA